MEQSAALTKLAVLPPVKKGDYFQDKIPVLPGRANSSALCARKPLFTLAESWGKNPSERCGVACTDQAEHFDKIPPSFIKKSPEVIRLSMATLVPQSRDLSSVTPAVLQTTVLCRCPQLSHGPF